MLETLKTFAIEQILWAEKHLKGKTGAEKKAAVVKKLDDMIQLPAYLEWADDLIISWFVDTVCEKLNEQTAHHIEKLKLSEEQEKELANSIEIPDSLLKK